MKTKIIWTLFMVSMGTSSFVAQEKQPPKEKPPAAPATAATTTFPNLALARFTRNNSSKPGEVSRCVLQISW